jgi:hypothetical protein
MMQVGAIAMEDKEQVHLLVEELLPVAYEYLQKNGFQDFAVGAKEAAAKRAPAVTDSLIRYSLQISRAVPSVSMAHSEFLWRNGFFLDQCATPLHSYWLLKAQCPDDFLLKKMH